MSHRNQWCLPDDPEQNRFRFIIVAAARARQIYRGASPIIPTGSRKPTKIAMIESQKGLIRYESPE